MAAIGDKIYVAGGGYNDNTATSSGEVLDLQTMHWKALPEMGSACFGLGGFERRRWFGEGRSFCVSGVATFG